MSQVITCNRRERFPLRHARPTTPRWARNLTARERGVLHCVARGMSNEEIASELFISVATVKTHIARLLDKVGARDRLQLAVAARSSGFVQYSASKRPA